MDCWKASASLCEETRGGSGDRCPYTLDLTLCLCRPVRSSAGPGASSPHIDVHIQPLRSIRSSGVDLRERRRRRALPRACMTSVMQLPYSRTVIVSVAFQVRGHLTSTESPHASKRCS